MRGVLIYFSLNCVREWRSRHVIIVNYRFVSISLCYALELPAQEFKGRIGVNELMACYFSLVGVCLLQLLQNSRNNQQWVY